MAGTWGLVWDRQSLRVVECRARGGTPVVVAALRLETPWQPAEAENLGTKLKAEGKAAGLTAGPVYAVVGRDWLLSRDLRIPRVPAEEEPALVQFQTLMEITLATDDAVIDYLPAPGATTPSERTVLAMVLRRDIVATLEKLCSAAGLRLAAIVPQALVLAEQASSLLQQFPADNAVALVVGNELAITRGKQVEFTRHLGLEPDQHQELAAELRRSLAAYSNQPNRPPVAALLLADDGIVDHAALQEQLRMPVRLYSPLQGLVSVGLPEPSLDFAAPVAAAQLGCHRQAMPINFLAPRRPPVKPNRTKLYAAVILSIAGILGLTVAWFYFSELAAKEEQLRDLTDQIERNKKVIAGYGDVDQRVAAIAAWANQEVVLLDELYELIAAFPDTAGIRITKATWVPLAAPPLATAPRLPPVANLSAPSSATKSPTIRPVAQLTLEIIAEAGDRLDALRSGFDGLKHWKREVWEKDSRNPNQARAVYKIFPQPPDDYATVLSPGTHQTTPGAAEPAGNRRRPFLRPPGPGGRP